MASRWAAKRNAPLIVTVSSILNSRQLLMFHATELYTHLYWQERERARRIWRDDNVTEIVSLSDVGGRAHADDRLTKLITAELEIYGQIMFL